MGTINTPVGSSILRLFDITDAAPPANFVQFSQVLAGESEGVFDTHLQDGLRRAKNGIWIFKNWCVVSVKIRKLSPTCHVSARVIAC